MISLVDVVEGFAVTNEGDELGSHWKRRMLVGEFISEVDRCRGSLLD